MGCHINAHRIIGSRKDPWKLFFVNNRTAVNIMATKKRLEREFHNLRKNPNDSYRVELRHGDIFEWLGSLKGLKNSPYEGGTFNFHLQFTCDYPEKPPTLKFTTKIYHPNVNGRTGAVGWNMLGKNWHHNNTMEKVMMSLRALLGHPELQSTADNGMAIEFAYQRKRFVEHAKEWTQRCAMERQISTRIM
jgi:ubiquitin-conjugating enzyme E2 D/E